MGLALSNVQFDENVDIELLIEDLRKHTSVDTKVEYRYKGSKGFAVRIMFKPNRSEYDWDWVGCNFAYKEKGVIVSVESSLDALNKYPCYFHLATLVCLSNLGGKILSSSPLPEHAYLTWEQWVINNGSGFPLWKKLTFIVLGAVSFVSFLLYLIFICIPFLVIMLGFSWVIFFLKGQEASRVFAFRWAFLFKFL